MSDIRTSASADQSSCFGKIEKSFEPGRSAFSFSGAVHGNMLVKVLDLLFFIALLVENQLLPSFAAAVDNGP